MRGYSYCVAVWLLVAVSHVASGRKVAVDTPHIQSARVQEALAAIDLEAAKTDHHVKISSAHQLGKSHQGGQGVVAAKGSKVSQGHSETHDHHAQKKGAEGKEKQVVTHGEQGGKTHSSHVGAKHQAQHHDSKQGQVGHKYKEGDHHKKTGFSKGFHDKYHKDEYHKLDKYWKNANQNGAFHKFGEHGEHYHKESAKHGKGGKSLKSAQAVQHGKKGKSAKGHQSSDHKGHQGHKDFEKQNAHSSQYAKKGGHSGNKHTYKVHE